MCKLFITATNTDVGKTYSILKLIEFFQAKGLRVIAIKPFESGVISNAVDSSAILELLDDSSLSIDDILYYRFKLPASIYVANESKIKIDYEGIKKRIEMLETLYDVVLIEGAGGLYVPLELDFYMIDLIKYLDTKALLITSSKLGSINDTLLSIKALESYGIIFEWCINLHQDKDSFYEITYPFYRDKFGGVKSIQDDIEQIVQKLQLF
jgi:dethiobiotin synthetase